MKVQFALMGGLGNQLFQLAAALRTAGEIKQRVFLNPNLGHYRSNSSGLPEIMSFNVPDNITVLDKRFYSGWLGKLYGHRRKIFLSPRGVESIWAYRFLVNLVAELHTLLILGKGGKIETIEEIGFHKIDLHHQNTIFLGYFQSFRFTEASLETLKKLTTEEFKLVQDSYRDLAKNSSPLVIHIRLGDYLFEDAFGVPNSNYYKTAIEIQMMTNLYDSIWLFSDELEKALSFIPVKYHHIVKCVGEAQKSSAATLEIMRFGAGYIIGNSTFSWWGATLSHSLYPKVVAPEPWFKGMREPKDIVPTDWLRIPAWAE